jgi:hypothetical protein
MHVHSRCNGSSLSNGNHLEIVEDFGYLKPYTKATFRRHLDICITQETSNAAFFDVVELKCQSSQSYEDRDRYHAIDRQRE